jgi:O-Antigen ligase
VTTLEPTVTAHPPASIDLEEASARARVRRLAAVLGAPVVVASLVIWLGFNAGGFFPGTVGFGALAAGALLLAWVTLAVRPFEGASLPLLVAVGALTLYAVWVLASAAWSHAPARALIEFDRALLYVLVLVVVGLSAGRTGGARGVLHGLAAGAVVVCGCGLITRVLPDVWPIQSTLKADRLSYPVTYWNTLGLLGAMGWVTCLHLSSSLREARALRVLAAAALPVLGATVYFTFSRGAILVVPIGVVAYLALARPRGGVGALLAGVPATVVALVAAWSADALGSEHPTSPTAVAQGHHVTLVLVAAVLAAGAIRFLLDGLDARMQRLHVRLPSRGLLVAIVASLAALVAVGGVAAGVPHKLRGQYENFTKKGEVDPAGSSRDRLSDVGNNGRLDHWRVALKGFDASPLHGSGAGTYANLWARDRPEGFDVTDGHSLYLETMGELGIVGLGLIVTLVLALLGGALRRVRGPDRAMAGAVAAIVLMWAVRAGIDWDWEMPVVTVWALLAGGALLARPAAAELPGGGLVPGRVGRLLLGIGVLVLLVTPMLVSRSQAKLQESVRAFRAGDCAQAVNDALDANASLSVRPEPFEVLGFCDVRSGSPRLGMAALQGAIRRDPDNWEYRYGLALTKAASGLDPRPDARLAHEMNPRSPLTRDAIQRFAGSNPEVWKRRSVTAPLPQ